MKKTPPNQYRIHDHGLWSSEDDDGMNGAFSIPLIQDFNHKVIANCIVSDGRGWEHVSVHVVERGEVRTPSWNEMCAVKDIFWEPAEVVVQFHPAKSEYINNHPHVLHLWRCTTQEIKTPPSIMVGIKGLTA